MVQVTMTAVSLPQLDSIRFKTYLEVPLCDISDLLLFILFIMNILNEFTSDHKNNKMEG